MPSSDTTRPARGAAFRRRLGLGAGGVTLLLVAGGVIAWQLLALRVEAGIAGWTAQRRALGDRSEHDPPALGGFPFTVAVTMRQVHWIREDGPPLLTAAASEVVASARVWDPYRVTVRPSSGGRASVAGAWGSITADAEAVVAVVILGHRGAERFDLALRNLDLTGPGGAVLATVDAVDASIDPLPEPASGAVAAVPTTLAVSGHATGVRPAGAETLPFEGPATVSWRAALRGAVDPAAGLPGLALWRDAGGVIDVHHLAITWPPVDFVGDGTLALDAAMRPEGAGVAQVEGVAETLDRLVALGRMKAGDAALLRLAAIMASQPSGAGGRQRLRSPVSVQDGTVRIGGIAVAKVRSIAE